MNEFFQSINAKNISGKQLGGYVAGVLGTLVGFYLFMVSSEVWGFSITTTKEKPVVETIDGKEVTTINTTTDTAIDHAMNVQGLLGFLSVLGAILLAWGLWGVVKIPDSRIKARFYAVLSVVVGVATIVGVTVANFSISGKVGEHYGRGAAFGAIFVVSLVWSLWFYRDLRRNNATGVVAAPTF